VIPFFFFQESIYSNENVKQVSLNAILLILVNCLSECMESVGFCLLSFFNKSTIFTYNLFGKPTGTALL